MQQLEARTIPKNVAVCPICGKKLWIEEIGEASQESDRWIPQQVSVACEDEPDIDSEEWRDWHNWHYAMPYVDWLPISQDVLKWLQQPEQRDRVTLIWGD